MNENDQTFFVMLRKGEDKIFIVRWVRRDAQLKGLVELERRCRDTSQKMQVLSGRQDEKRRKASSSCRAEQIFEEQKVRKNFANGAEEARFMQISE